MREGYKMTDLGEIPAEWEVKKIEEVASINPESLTNKTEGGLTINYIDIESVSTGRINNTKQFIFSEAPSRARRKVKKDDVIISTVRPYLKAFAKVKDDKENLVCSTGFAVLRSKRDISSEYIFQCTLCDSFLNQLESKMVGSNYPAVNTSDVAETLISIPAFPEQQKIADILSTVDEQIENTESLIEKTKELKKGLMQRLLTKGIGHTEFKETEVGVIPKEWEVKKIRDVSTLCTNGFVGTASPYYTEDEDGIPYLMSNNVRANKIDERSLIKINNEFVLKYPKSKIYEGDMLTVQSGHIGTSCVVPEKYNDCNCHALIITRFVKGSINPNFIAYYLNSIGGVSRLSNIFVGTTVKHINVKDFLQFLVPVPSKEEQNKISNIISSVDDQITNYQTQKTNLQTLKQALMQKLLTGKIRVKV